MSEDKPKIAVVGAGPIGLAIAAHLGSSCQVEMIEMTAEQSETLFKKSRRGQTVILAEAIEQDRTFPITNPYADLPEIRYPSTLKGKQRSRPTNFTKPKKRRR